MIVEDELRFLHFLALNHIGGAVIDMGPLAGGSTLAMGTGLQRGRIHSYDLWQHFPGFEQYFGPDSARLDLAAEFRKNIATVAHLVVPHQGDILRQRWSGQPIGLMFIDAAKSPALMRHIANEWFPSLSPGAYVVHQDYVSAEDPWIHVAMGILKDHFELMDSPEGGSVCFRVVKPIPSHAIPANYMEGAREHVHRAADNLNGWYRLCVELAEAHYVALSGSSTEEVFSIVRAVQASPLYVESLYAYDLGVIERALGRRVRATVA